MNRRDAIKALMTVLPATAVISKAAIQPADVIVIEVDECVDPDQAARIRERLKEVWPHNKVVICTQGAKLKIVKGGADG